MSEWKTYEEILPEIGRLMTDDPEFGYERVERRWKNGKSKFWPARGWDELFDYADDNKYRIKPHEMKYTVRRPQPLQEMPKPNEMYWAASPDHEDWAFYFSWSDEERIRRDFERGLCYGSKKEAAAAAKAMVNWRGE